ncbi:MAG: tRNA 2-thiouridine(34) synthase MnmA [Oligoflexia bacterium]|nr:tRNA 2-thiouridine(34) synthase MnmA [Oligoflexia bacterium]
MSKKIKSAKSSKGSKKVAVVGMSGGVDSAVAALLLKQSGYDVIGIFMRNWEESEPLTACSAAKDFEDVVSVCEKLQIPYYSVEFIKEYFDEVFAPSIEEYKRGLTPNPDVLCNLKIKFKIFYEKALQLGADFVATGHYCRCEVDKESGEKTLLKGSDPGKDQSYFLYTIKKDILSRVLFPIGGMLKREVRELACKHGLDVYNKKDSTGICFIGEKDFANFLQKYIPKNPGPFKTLNGEIVGEHEGFPFYTIGQRKGLGLGGAGAPWYVIGKDPKQNIVYVERGENHPALYASKLYTNNLSFVADRPFFNNVSNNASLPLLHPLRAKIRYRQSDQECSITAISGTKDCMCLEVSFVEPQRAITPGQAIVFYRGDICLGGGTIMGDAIYSP